MIENFSREENFRRLVRILAVAGIYPSPSRLLLECGRRPGQHNLNGRQCRWRAEELTKLGWRHRNECGRVRPRRRLQWDPPPGLEVR